MFIRVPFFDYLEEQGLGQRFGDKKLPWEVIPTGLSRRMESKAQKERKLIKGFPALVAYVIGL